MYIIHQGTVGSGFQFASGKAVGRAIDPSPFSDGTIKLQAPHFRDRDFDLSERIPGLFWGTINIQLPYELSLQTADHTFEGIDWTADERNPSARIAPETFSFVRCCVAYGGYYRPGYIYYPHPETKPATNAHNYSVVEVLTQSIDELSYGRPIGVVCLMDAFRRRRGGAQ